MYESSYDIRFDWFMLYIHHKSFVFFHLHQNMPSILRFAYFLAVLFELILQQLFFVLLASLQ